MHIKQVRQKFLDFFAKHDHQKVASSSLIPAEDPTLLFANAGMNQFKDVFLGKEKRNYTRATTAQKCVRAGGKHNDLEEVGFTARHLTFFEMIGNFSFGDYFKEEAIAFAWELLTKEYGLPEEKLYPTVYFKDDESFAIWEKQIGIPAHRIGRLDEKDNFWSMGDTGPCGPCTEIYYDQGSDIGCGSKKCAPGCECDRFIEIWNLVFMQYNRDANGNLSPLAQTGVDTGAGLERVTCVLEGKKNVFDSSAFTNLRAAIEKECDKTFATSDAKIKGAFNVLCDHIRSSCLLIADGCSPSNDGRGYVLRKIIRRGILFAQKLSDDAALLPNVAHVFIETEKEVFPELSTSSGLIISVLEQEVARFTHNLHHGQAILEKYMLETKESGSTQLSGAYAFKLYDTFGFPLELTKVITGEHDLTVDVDGYEKHMAQQQDLSKGKSTDTITSDIPFPQDIATEFVGYDNTEITAQVVWEYTNSDSRWIITDRCPFYVESGGQVNDEGLVTINEHSYHVVDLKKIGQRFAPAIAVKLKAVETMGTCNVGDTAVCEVNKQARIDTVRNHTATHMLHAALHQFIGKQAKQAGSVVNKEYLRFDYTHHEPLSAETLKKIEDRVNEKIWEDIHTNVFNTTLEDAKNKGIIAFFGEKYNPENVRVVSIPGFSNELCGGTHASSTGIIGAFKIVSDVSLATGTRRMVAITGPKALELYQQCYRDIKAMSEHFKIKVEQVADAFAKQTAQLQETTTALRQTKKQLLHASVGQFVAQIDTSGDIPHLFTTISDADGDALRTICQSLDAQAAGFYFLATNDTSKGKSQFLAWTSRDHQQRIDHKTVMELLRAHNLRGGGKPGTVQGGGPVVTADVLNAIKAGVQKLIGE